MRKSTGIPYLSHLLAVASLVLEDGGDEDEAIAGLLHDAIEDTDADQGAIAQRFGPRVAEIVDGCTDTDERPKPPWRPRKEAYLERLRTASPSVRRVARADKLHNARSLLTDYRRLGDAVWSRFSAGRDEQLWWYGALADEFRSDGVLGEELDRVVTELRLVASSPG